MKKIVAVFLILLSFANLYDTVLILNGTFLPPYTISLFGEMSTNTYLFYKISSAIVMLFVAYKIFNPDKELEKE